MTSMREIARRTARLGNIALARKHALDAVGHLTINGDIDAADRALSAALALVAQLKSQPVEA